MEGVTSLVLIPQAVDGTEKPLIAGGGFCDGRSLMVALALGAEGVNMGTRFMATKECPVPEAVKQKMVESPETSTVIVMQSLGNPSRVFRNAWAEKILELENQGASLEELAPYISGEAGRTGWLQGDLEKGLFSVGQAVGRVHDIPTVAELIQQIVTEAMEVKTKLDQIF